MILPRWLSRAVLLGLLIVPPTLSLVYAADLPGDSVYQLSVPMVDQEGRHFDFAGLRGKPRLITMFYTSCPYMCPLIIDTVRLTERELDAAERTKLSVLMISFDAERDQPDVLRAQSEKRKIDTARWTLAHTDAANVRKIAAMLGIQYRRLDDGDFNHSSVLILLDPEGRIAARTETMGKTDPVFVAATRRLLGGR